MKRILAIALVLLLPPALHANDAEDVSAKIRELEQVFNGAYGENDLGTYFGMYTEDATLIFYGARQPVPQYREEWSAEIAAGGGVERNDMSDMRIQVLADGEVAVATYILETVTRTAAGERSAVRAYETDIWQKREEGWRIISMHYSEIGPAD